MNSHSPQRRPLGALALAAALLLGTAAAAAQDTRPAFSDDEVKIGLILDMSGQYSDLTGRGTVTAAQMAIDDFGGKVLGHKIELVAADHQNKADIASTTARQWFDTGHVDAILDVASSAPGLAVLEVAKEKNRIVVFSAAGSERITNDLCTPVSVHYAYDTYAVANATARAVVQQGGKSWFFLTADYAFGHTLQDTASELIRESGGSVVGTAIHPFNTSDFSSYLLSAQASKAQIIGLASAGGDTVNAIKTASEFGITRGGQQHMVGLLLFINDIHAIGLQTAAGLLLTEGFYWDMNDATRAWSRRYFEKMKKMPNMTQAGTYSAVTHYLKAVQAAGTDETAAVMKQMKTIPINDFFAKNGYIRADGRMVHDMYLFEVKTPAESKYPWDYYKLRATIPGAQAFITPEKSQCPLIKR